MLLTTTGVGLVFMLEELIYSVSKKITPMRPAVSDIFSQTVENFKSVLHIYYTFLSTLDYKF